MLNEYKRIIDLSAKEARTLFLQSNSYFHCDLPEYFDFSPILMKVHNLLRKKNDQCATITELYSGKMKSIRREIRGNYDINVGLYLNKDGEYDWRRLQLINPILYVDLIYLITE